MRLYTKLDKQIDNYHEVASINKWLSKLLIKNFIFFVFLMYLWLLSGTFNLSLNLSPFSWMIFYSIFICSFPQKFYNLVILFYFLKTLFLLSFCSISLSISSIVTHFIVFACSKNLLCIKAIWPIFECVEYDSLLCF